MVRIKFFVVAAAVVVFAALSAPKASAQISIGVNVGPAPGCPYGYFDYAPYSCAPYGYYGSEWFHGGVFIGAGPWFHGPANFHGQVNNHFDPQHGYHGHLPAHGQRPDNAHPVGHVSHFSGNEQRDGKGHAYGGNNNHGH